MTTDNVLPTGAGQPPNATGLGLVMNNEETKQSETHVKPATPAMVKSKADVLAKLAA